MFRTTKAGGYVELADVGGKCYCDDGSSTLETNGYEYNVHLVSKALTSIGRPPATGAKMKKLLEEAGFVDVVVKEVKQPIGPWPKDPALKMIGAMNLLSLESGIEAYSLVSFDAG